MKIIVSLTSYPGRINNLSMVIKTLLIQTKRPDLIILWLAEDQFANEEKDLPDELLNLVSYGLTIRWCKDLKPHKKYFYAMQEYPEDIVITVDDDVYYSPRMVSVLMDEYAQHKNSVICIRANRIAKPDQYGRYDYSKFDIYYREICGTELTDVLPTGVGGVLYPPHCLPKQAFDEKMIRELCLYQDDIWLKAWSTINGFTNVITTEKVPIEVMEELQEDSLHVMNKDSGNDDAFYNVSQLLDKIYYKGILEEKLFSSGKSTDDYWNQACINQGDIFSDIEHLFKSVRLYVYGAGSNATLVAELLNKMKIHPYKYLVADPKVNPKKFAGVEVVGIDEEIVPSGPYRIIISPAEKNHQKILQDLRARGWDNFLIAKDEWMGDFLKGIKQIDKATHSIILDYLQSENKINRI